jgi:Zn-dependent oligopeptidase
VAQNAKDESRVDQKAAAVVICDLLDEYVEGISRDLAFCPTVNVNLLPHTHLVNYGGAYYSYLFAKMHAAQIWQNQFSEDPLSRYALL